MVKYHTVLVQEIFCLLAEDQSLIDTVLICMEHYPSTVLSNCTKNRPCWFELYKLYHCSWYKLWKSRGGSNLKAPKGFSEDKVETASVARPEAKNPRGHKLYHALHCTALHFIALHYSVPVQRVALRRAWSRCTRWVLRPAGRRWRYTGGRPAVCSVQVQCTDFSTVQITR